MEGWTDAASSKWAGVLAFGPGQAADTAFAKSAANPPRGRPTPRPELVSHVKARWTVPNLGPSYTNLADVITGLAMFVGILDAPTSGAFSTRHFEDLTLPMVRAGVFW